MAIHSPRLLAALLLMLFLAACWWWGSRATGAESGKDVDRVAAARARVEPGLRAACQKAGLTYPPQELFLRAFKSEAQLEVWARDDKTDFQLLETLPVLSSSGQPGPKRKEGDRQVPEGFYEIDRFNPMSSFHLSLRVNYPNASDRVLADREAPGSDIYIHGSNVTIGCLPLGDERIERLYVLALDTKATRSTKIPVHIFPARMKGESWVRFQDEQAVENAGLRQFWSTLQKGYEAFEQTRKLPKVLVREDGKYVIAPAAK